MLRWRWALASAGSWEEFRVSFSELFVCLHPLSLITWPAEYLEVGLLVFASPYDGMLVVYIRRSGTFSFPAVHALPVLLQEK